MNTNPQGNITLEIPNWIKLCVTLVAGLIVFVSGFAILNYVFGPSDVKAPKEFGASGLLIFSVAALSLVWIPWRAIGVKKIGGIEFFEEVQIQSDEQLEEISGLQARLDYLEMILSANEGSVAEAGKQVTEELSIQTDPQGHRSLSDLLIEFLEKYNSWSFSSTRIVSWGSRQSGFDELSNYSWKEVRSELQDLASKKLIETRKSKNGNQLFVARKA